MAYHDQITQAQTLIEGQSTWNSISPESVARMRLQNRFQTGLEIAATPPTSCARTWRPMMPTRRSTPSRSAAGTASSAQQKLISIKKHFGTTERRYLYLSGWMVAALRSEFGPLPDQSMHEKTACRR